MKLIAKKDFTINGEYFYDGKEVVTKDYSLIVRLNEKGFIYPITRKELTEIKEELENPKRIKVKKEEE